MTQSEQLPHFRATAFSRVRLFLDAPFMSNTLKVSRVVPKYRQVVVGKSHVVKFMKSSLPEVEKAYRKSDYSHRKEPVNFFFVW